MLVRPRWRHLTKKDGRIGGPQRRMDANLYRRYYQHRAESTDAILCIG